MSITLNRQSDGKYTVRQTKDGALVGTWSDLTLEQALKLIEDLANAS